MEKAWANLLKSGNKVRVDITIAYRGDSMRPTRFAILHWINDVGQDPIDFKNKYGGK